MQIGGIIDELFENDTATAIPESDAGSTTGDLVDPLQDKELVPINEDNAENFLCVQEDIKEEFFEDSDVPKVLRKERIFECNKCDFKSVHYASVRKHNIYKHDGIKYECDKCEKSFIDSSTLLRHKKSIHDGVVYRCELCLKTFSDGSALTRHKKVMHSTTIPPIYDPFSEF